MRQLLALLCLMLCPLLAFAEDEVLVTVTEKREPPKENDRPGLELVRRTLTIGNAQIRYVQLVNPQDNDRVVTQRYGDYFLGCDFPRYTWNWDLQSFLDVTVARGNGKPFVANRAVLQEGTYALLQGKRGVADMVWALPAVADAPPAKLAVRLVKLPEDPQWMYLRISIEGDPAAKLTQIQLSTYPYITAGPPERQRWAATLTRAAQMSNAPWVFNPGEEWAVALHNKYAHEDGGPLILLDPAQVTSGSIRGTYSVAVTLAPSRPRVFTAAIGYFWDTPYEKAVAAFRQSAPERLGKLRGVDWSVPVDLARWRVEQREIADILTVLKQPPGKLAEQWQALQAEAEQLQTELGKPEPDPAAYRRMVLVTREAQALKSQLYEPALQELIRQATQ